ncbi:MAG: transporter substrate-binding protein [Herbinix sp.]|nr:transporter substrate-binding protein [Herbinix sp.]
MADQYFFGRKTKIHKRLFAFLLCTILILTNFSTISYAEQMGTPENEQTEINEDSLEEDTQAELETSEEGSYERYLENHEDVSFADKEILLDAAKFSDTDQNIEVFKNFEGSEKDAILTPEEGYVEWQFDVEQSGMYQINLTYYPYEGKGSTIERIMLLDGEVPYKEANYITFPRIWKDVYTSAKKDISGNDIRPQQQEVKQWMTADFKDSSGFYSEPLSFYLEKGTHTLRLISEREPLMIASILFFHKQSPISYSELKSEYTKQGYQAANGEIVYKQAEEMEQKSEKSNYPINDRSSSFTQPQDVNQVLLNTMGGSKWQTAGSSVTWKITVLETGLYKLAPRYRQNVYSGVYVTRKLLINGEIPFAEASNLQFNYSADWKCNAIGNGTEDYLFFFEAGKEYEITMEAVLGDMGDVLRRVQNVVVDLNAIYRKILMITGATPDKYRDYEFDKLIPETIAQMEVEAAELEDLVDKMIELTGSKGERVSQLEKMAFLVRRMVEEPDEIAGKFKYFKDSIAALGTWILETSKQPLEIDYIAFVPSEQKAPKANDSFFGNIAFAVKLFFSSFSVDYDSVGTTEESLGKEDASIKVWLSTGRDQQSIIRSLINSYFTPDTGITVELELVNPGTLLPSILAGRGPDVSLSNGMGDPINYAVRNAVADISVFEDYEEVTKRFHESAMVPYQYKGATYALPETQSFNMMFYRTDIFEELGLEIPTTWKEWDILIPELQKKNMSIGLPHDLNTLLMFMYQNDTELYINEGEKTNLDSQGSILSFIKMMDYFKLYDFPTEYDFANRFRSGEMPLAIADYTVYNQLSLFAPEIKGNWEMVSIPGTVQEDGTMNRIIPSSGSSVIMMKDAKNPDAAWEFMKWWTSAEIQSSFGTEMESVINAAAKQPTANMEALKMLPWSTNDLNNILAQWEYVKGTPEVPGGYYTARVLTFAFNKVYNDKKDAADVLQSYIEPMNAELKRKRQEFGIE